MSLNIAILPSQHSTFNFSCIPNDQGYSLSELVLKEEKQSLETIELLGKGKFPVFLVNNPETNVSYAIKIFEYKEDQPHSCFYNEARFSFLSHPNIIRMHDVEHKDLIICSEEPLKVSSILLEYAPYGDFHEFLKNHQQFMTEKMVRTYFRQLVEGLEYLHSQGVCHLDLKLSNLLLGEDYQLKISDFDLSYRVGDSKIYSKGSKLYRAPELKNSECKDAVAADMYSLGVILFVLKSGGVVPHAEDQLYDGVDLRKLLHNDSRTFFRKQCTIQDRRESFYSADFRELFISLMHTDPEERATIEEVKNSKWYQDEIYTDEELKEKVGGLFTSN